MANGDNSEKVFSASEFRVLRKMLDKGEPAMPTCNHNDETSVTMQSSGTAITAMAQRPGWWGVVGIVVLIVMQAVNPKLEAIGDGVDDVKAAVTTLQASVSSIQGTVNRLEGTTNMHSSALNSQAADIEKLSKELAFQGRLLSNVRVNVDTLEGVMENVYGQRITLKPEPVREGN